MIVFQVKLSPHQELQSSPGALFNRFLPVSDIPAGPKKQGRT